MCRKRGSYRSVGRHVNQFIHTTVDLLLTRTRRRQAFIIIASTYPSVHAWRVSCKLFRNDSIAYAIPKTRWSVGTAPWRLGTRYLIIFLSPSQPAYVVYSFLHNRYLYSIRYTLIQNCCYTANVYQQLFFHQRSTRTSILDIAVIVSFTQLVWVYFNQLRFQLVTISFAYD